MRCTVLCQRRPDGTRAFHAGSFDQSSILIRDRNRHVSRLPIEGGFAAD